MNQFVDTMMRKKNPNSEKTREFEKIKTLDFGHCTHNSWTSLQKLKKEKLEEHGYMGKHMRSTKTQM